MTTTVEQFPAAIAALKKHMHIIAELHSSEALAAISIKLVDVVEAITNNDLKQGLSDIWGCSYAIQHTIYLSLSEMLKKKSERAIAAKLAAEDKDYEKATTEYCKANAEITKDMGYNALFLEHND